jgi:hypothetical protein
MAADGNTKLACRSLGLLYELGSTRENYDVET